MPLSIPPTASVEPRERVTRTPLEHAQEVSERAHGERTSLQRRSTPPDEEARRQERYDELAQRRSERSSPPRASVRPLPTAPTIDWVDLSPEARAKLAEEG